MDEIAFLEAFVRIPSLSHQEAAAAAFLVEQMQALGFAAHVDGAGNAVGAIGDTGPQVVLLGHIDTVAGAVPVQITEGKLYGRGAVDAKGPFATFVCAAARAYYAGGIRCQIVLIGAVEEEAASSKGAHYVVDKYAPGFCIIGEPSSWDRVTLGYKGRLLLHYRHEQPSAHSAGELRAAPERLVDFWTAVQRYCERYNAGRERLFVQLLPSLRRISSGGDGLHDWAEGTIGLRLPEGIDPAALADELRSLAAAAEISSEGGCPAFRSPRTTPLASAFVRSIRANGGQPGFLHKTGTADMNVVGPVWRCPIVAYGPGDSRLDHTPNEHIDLDEYQRAIAVLTGVLKQLR
ncbi:MAG: [LysW]-lysine hydrolase [Chloroflexales bacterium]|nr:[LysW]-lysine hydrolase [Chloroflexales bacterium]